MAFKGWIDGLDRNRKEGSGSMALIRVEGITSRHKGVSLIGKRVVWTTTAGKKLAGKIVRWHGGGGLLRARFSTGIPGQVVGQAIEIV